VIKYAHCGRNAMGAESPSDTSNGGITWYRALSPDELPEGRVKAVTCGETTVAVTHYNGEYAALDNNCPHQGGPLGEGSIETGWLRCPWHGWDFDPLTGETPGPHDDCVETFPVEERVDGIYVGFPEEVDDPRTKRTIRTYLSKMEQYNLLEAEGTSRDREYSLVDSAAASPMQ
jgi:nitrite reductase/ring-hydroxylating ferredoxin subunit